MSETVNLTVTELMAAYRDSLLALIPVMERCCIPWQEPHTYDDWEEISTVLFRRIVVASLTWGLSNPPHPVRVAEPGFQLDSYADLDWIEIICPETAPGHRLVFVEFSTGQKPFDQIKSRSVTPEGIPDHREVRLPFHGVTFRLAWRQARGHRQLTEHLHILR